MTDNDDYNPSLNEGHRLHLEATDTSYINTTLLDLDRSISDDLSSLINNNAPSPTNPTNTVSPPKAKPLQDERKIITPKKRRKKVKETGNSSSLIGVVAAEDSSLTESAKTSTNGILTGGITNSPSPSQAKISDDFTTCSFLINLDGSALPLENDNTDRQCENFGAENLSCSMLSDVVGNDIENISTKIQDFQDIIMEKDKRIEEMAKMLEMAMRHKENQDINLVRIAEDSERLEEKLNRTSICINPQVHESEVGAGGENTLDQFEMSSYLNPPNAHSLLICRPEMFPKETQTRQNENASVGVTCDISKLTPSMVQQKCQDLQMSSQTLRSEITSLKSYVTNYFQSIDATNSEELLRVINSVFHKQNADLIALKAQYSKDIDYQNNIQIQLREELDILKIQCEKTLEAKDQEIHALTDEIKQLHEKDKEFKLQQENEIQTVQLTNEGVIKNKNDEIRTLIAKNSRLEETLKIFNSDKKKEIDQVKLRNEENLRNKNEEVRSLRVKVSQLEDAKRNEHKLNSLSSRLSPEGSELEGDISVADSTSGGESHYRLTRMKNEYLKLTPPVECIEDGDVLEHDSSLSEHNNNSAVEDLKLQLLDVEKKYDANRKYLEEQTIEREQERDEYHRTIDDYRLKNEELKKENDRLTSSVASQKHEIGDCEMRLKDAFETEQDLNKKCERFEDELKSAVDKIFELREIIRDLEEQIDSATVNAIDLKEQNQILSEELDRLETLKRDQDDAKNTTQDTVNTLGGDMVEELQTQLGDITRRLERKLNEMDNFPWQTRPNSSCSGAISVSTEDVSVREFSYINRDKECDPKEAGPLLCDGLRRLDTHFENFVRFQEIIVKKLQDADLRLSFSKKRIEDLENEKLIYQENAKTQINTIADLESRLDQFRFEPSPSVVTLSGLRARVSSLTEECDQYKGNLELRTYELQDAIKRHAATQAMFEQYKKMTAQSAVPQVSKYSVQTQSQINVMNNSFTQTDKAVKNVSTKEACVQTNEFLKDNEKFKYFNRPSFELSTIHGGPAPTFSTPNDVVNLQKSSIKNNNANAWSFLGGGDADSILGGTPETARNRGQPSLLALSTEKSIERLSNKSVSFNFKALDQERGDRGRPADADTFGLGADESYDFLDDKPEKSGRLSKDRSRQPLTSINGPKTGDSGQSDKTETSKRKDSKPPGNEIQPTESDLLSSDNDPKSRRLSSENDPQSKRLSSDNDPQSRRLSSGQKKNSVPSDNGAESGPRQAKSSEDTEEPLPEESNRSDATNDLARKGSDGRRDSQNRKSSGYDSEGRRVSEGRKNSKGQPGDNTDDSQRRKSSDGRRGSKSRPDGYAYDGKMKNSKDFSEEPSNWTMESSPVSDKDSADRYSNFEDDIDSDSSMDDKRRNSKQKRSLQPDLFDSSDDERMREEMQSRSMPKGQDENSPSRRNSESKYAEGNESSMPRDYNYLTQGTKEEQIEKMLKKIGELEDRLKGKLFLETSYDLVKQQAETTLRDGLGDGEKKVQYPMNAVGEIGSEEVLEANARVDVCYAEDEHGGIHLLDTKLQGGEGPDTLANQMYGPTAIQRGRIADTDLQIELEALKTQQNILQQALDRERARNQELEDVLSQLRNVPAANSFVGGYPNASPVYSNQQQSPGCRNVDNQGQTLMDAYEEAVAARQDAEAELEEMRQEWDRMQKEKDNEIKILKTQLETAAQQVHRKNSVLNETRQSDSSTLRQKVSSMNYLELYLKTRSFRKALIWQKKYLLLTIQGYKDILRASGIQYDPDLLQKEIVIAPSSVGLADRRKPLTRFKIVAKAMVALARMKYMVHRWDAKSPKILSAEESPAAPSSRITSAGPSSRVASRTESKRAVTTPPSRETKSVKSSAAASITNIPLQRDPQTNRRSSVNPRFPNATVNPIEFSNAPSTSTVPRPTASGTTVLSQYLDRFEYLENQLGSSLGRETNRRPSDHEHDE